MASTYELILEVVDKTSKPINDVNKALKSTNTRATKVNATVKKMNSTFKSIGRVGLKGLGSLTRGLRNAGLAATAAAGAFAFMAKSTINQLDTLGKVANKLGVTTEFLSKYQVIANRAGISTETFNMGLQRFLRRLGEAQMGTGELLKPLQKMGISMKDSNGKFRDGTEVFQEFMMKLAGTTNSTEKLALAMKGFDSEGVAMVNIADMGAAKIALIGQRAEEAGLVISGSLTKAAEEANDSLSDLFDFGKGFRMQFFGALSETIEELSEMLRERIKISIEGAGGMKAFANDLAAAFLEGTSRFITAVAGFVDDFTNAFATFTNALKQIIVAISNIPGVGFDAKIGAPTDQSARKKALQEELDVINEQFEEMSKVAFGLGNNIDTGMQGAMDSMMLRMQELRSEINAIENDTTMYFQWMETDSTTAADAVGKVTSKIDEQAVKLRENAEKFREEAKAKKENADATEDLTNKNNTMVQAMTPAQIRAQEFGEFMKKLQEQIAKTTKETEFKAQALSFIKKEFEAGRMSIDAYAHAVKILGMNTGKTKEEIDKLKGVLPELSGFDKFMKDLTNSASAAATKIEHEAMAVAELDKLLAAGKINIDTYAQAMMQIGKGGKPGGDGKDDPLTVSEELVKSYTDQREKLKQLNDALANVDVLAKEAGVSQEFLTEKIKEQMEALEIYQAKAKTTQEIIEEGFQGISKSISSELATAIRTGESLLGALENVFTRTLDNILQKILESQIEQALSGLFGGLGGGGGGFSLGNLLGTPTVGAPFGGLKIPFLANGGIAKKGQPSIVGDGGEPELFIPGQTGRVTPMSQLNTGGGKEVNVVFNLNAVDTQTGVEFLLKNKPQIIGMVSQGFNQRGRAGITS